MDKLNTMLDKFGKDLGKYPILCKAEETTNCPKQYLVLGAGSILLSCLLMGFGASLICNLGGYVYPAYCSFKAIESASTKDDTQWLTYWIVFAAFSILEAFLSVLLHWIPFYFALKLAFLAWCFLPQTRGAALLYNSFMKDFLASNNAANPIPAEGKVEGMTSHLKDT
ncbi:unnamed protein product [Ectocarpus sp. CCAP 1310/34]|nr:unnamed protein product [Ectocarpus sp. CCAP 1310/34]